MNFEYLEISEIFDNEGWYGILNMPKHIYGRTGILLQRSKSCFEIQFWGISEKIFDFITSLSKVAGRW